MISRFFIDRPIAANVIAWITILLGLVALERLPVEQYPQIAPPTVVVSTTYPGASAQVVNDTVATPIEQQVNGVEGMLYMSSTCASDGTYSATVTFDIGTDLNMAQVLVQNRVATALNLLPDEVRRQGVTVKKQSTSIVLAVFLESRTGVYDNLFLTNYATLHLRDDLSRVPGVGDVMVRGTGAYSMRIWIDPEKLRTRNMTTQDVVSSLQEQNVQVAAGQLGQQPGPRSQNFQNTLTTIGRLSDPRQFEAIVVKSGEQGKVVYLRDIARVELGSQTYDSFTLKNGVPATAIIIYQLPGANSIEVSKRVHAAMKEICKSFPTGLEYEIPFDTTLFVASAVREVYQTLFAAGMLVMFVILVFLQSWRAVLVPMTTVPVTLIGAFFFMSVLGFTVNLLTLFGLVLAIGIVVDDAIVIVENAAHHIERGESPRLGTANAMDEVTGPVIGITAVLMSVFVPTVFMRGITGQLYSQFALTIAATALISAINALTLKPAQCASWLRPETGKSAFGRVFDAVFDLVRSTYVWSVRKAVRHVASALIAFVALLGLAGWLYTRLPTGFLPTEDQGYAICNIQLPDAASLNRTREVVNQVNAVLASTKGVAGWFFLGGFSLIDGANISNSATAFIVFDDWKKRTDPSLSLDGIQRTLAGKFAEIQDAIVFTFAPPSIRGLGVSGGFQMQVEDRGDIGMAQLQQATDAIVQETKGISSLAPTNSTFRAGVPQYALDIDRAMVKTMNVNLNDVFTTLQAALGSTYVNDFNRFGLTFQVRVQADSQFRMKKADIGRLYVRNRRGGMVPMSALVKVRRTFGPQTISRFNMYPTASITGAAAQGFSSGQGLDTMEEIAGRVLPSEVGFDWTGMAYQEKRVSGQAVWIFGLAVLMTYLVLCFLYESWLIPLSVILVVPIGVLGAAVAVAARGMDNNVYTQIGIVLIIALACKNAILIVEFARDLREKGMEIGEAAIEASRMRFRPILMTSFAFILGVLPLVWAEGAAAASRQALGTAVFGGMVSSTVLAIFFVPPLWVVLQRISEWASRKG